MWPAGMVSQDFWFTELVIHLFRVPLVFSHPLISENHQLWDCSVQCLRTVVFVEQLIPLWLSNLPVSKPPPQFHQSVYKEEFTLEAVHLETFGVWEGVRSRYSLSPEQRKNSWQLYFNPRHQYLITRVFLGPIAFRIYITLICAKCT